MKQPQWPVSTEREMELLRQVLESDRWGGYHEFVKQFEHEFAAFVHCAHGVSAMNGTVTLEMALAAAGVGPGNEVIVPAISFISTATAVSRVGATPVFVDIEPLSFNMDPERAAAAVTPRTKAIIPVHFGGPMADMDRLLPLAAKHGLAVIEDAAHAHGSEWNGRRAGSLGLAGSFSFQNSKVMTAGEGGMLTTNDTGFAERAWSLMDQGRKPGGGWFHHFVLASNYRITGLHAAVLLAQLERLPEQICRRTRNAATREPEALHSPVAAPDGSTALRSRRPLCGLASWVPPWVPPWKRVRLGDGQRDGTSLTPSLIAPTVPATARSSRREANSAPDASQSGTATW